LKQILFKTYSVIAKSVIINTQFKRTKFSDPNEHFTEANQRSRVITNKIGCSRAVRYYQV
jgi:hypothetical protein